MILLVLRAFQLLLLLLINFIVDIVAAVATDVLAVLQRCAWWRIRVCSVPNTLIVLLLLLCVFFISCLISFGEKFPFKWVKAYYYHRYIIQSFFEHREFKYAFNRVSTVLVNILWVCYFFRVPYALPYFLSRQFIVNAITLILLI